MSVIADDGRPDEVLVAEVETSDRVHATTRDEVYLRIGDATTPALLRPAATQATRFARNPRTARVLADMDFGQELGEGIRRMFDEMRLAGLDQPSYRQTSGSVRLTLSTEPVDRALEDRLPPNARALVRTIRERERPSTGDLATVTGRSRPTTLRDLRALEEAGVVERVGTSRKDPRAHWRIASRAGGPMSLSS